VFEWLDMGDKIWLFFAVSVEMCGCLRCDGLDWWGMVVN